MADRAYRKKFLFIDDAYVVRMENLTRTTNQAVKRTASRHPQGTS